jgi:AraC-like DNA-binding protein
METAAIERHVGDLWREAQSRRIAAPAMHAITRRSVMELLDNPELARDTMAQRIGGCPSELSRHFHKDMGLTLASFRTRLRLLRFIERADQGAGSLLAAALEAGFGSYSQCHRMFQRTLGCAPSAFFDASARRQMADAFSPEQCVGRVCPTVGSRREFSAPTEAEDSCCTEDRSARRAGARQRSGSGAT